MFEYSIPEEHHLAIKEDLTLPIDLTIATLGDVTSSNLANGAASDLLFSAKYFDNLVTSRTTNSHSKYFKVLSASSYYLCGFPGSAFVILKSLEDEDLDCSNLDELVISIITKSFSQTPVPSENPFKQLIESFRSSLVTFMNDGVSRETVIASFDSLRNQVYKCGNDREILFIDVLKSVTELFLKNSVWTSLPLFSNLDVNLWRDYNRRNGSIKELWPAQEMLGQQGIFNGRSGIIQMPTSAGKTKSAELIIRSSILSGRASLIVVVAPFRALCREIYDELKRQFSPDANVYVNLVSDVLQNDLEQETVPVQIAVLTPEKLEYILRQDPSYSDPIGLIIFDESHLFDDNSRGAKYELLLSSLKSKLSSTCQRILISAVMPNSKEVGEWFIGNTSQNVQAQNLYPTTRNIAFVSWPRSFGQLHFMNSENIDSEDFYVPRVFSSHNLQLRKRETKQRTFPLNDDPNSIALILGCSLVQSGPVAIFSGRKDSISSLGESIVDAFDRGLPINKPSSQCNQEQLLRLQKYIAQTSGADSVYYSASLLGIFSHHGSTPHGLRLSVEYAFQHEMIKFVLCTSTLAQGVNLPIRYLIVTTDMQGGERILVRDFHNLIGRAGRAGKYTEGTIIFSNPAIFDGRRKFYESWRWRRIRVLLNPDESESCYSLLLQLFKTPENDEEKAFQEFQAQQIRYEISSYLLEVLSEIPAEVNGTEFITEIVKNTLAYYQADSEEIREQLLTLFKEEAEKILSDEPDADRRKVFAKSSVDLPSSKLIYEFLQNKLDNLNEALSASELLEVLWEILYSTLSQWMPKIDSDLLRQTCSAWTRGTSFPNLLLILEGADFGKLESKRRTKPNIDKVVELCENKFGFTGSLLVGSCKEILSLFEDYTGVNEASFLFLQKMLKYGLNDKLQIKLYELGFCDRKLSEEIEALIHEDVTIVNRESAIAALKEKSDEISDIITDRYPEYFSQVLRDLVA